MRLVEQQQVQSGTEQANGRRVLISGASFAGLASAWWMQRLGYHVTIVESAPAVRRGGTPVDIREGVLDVVARMGLLDRIKAHALPFRPTVFLDEGGKPLRQVVEDSHEPESNAAQEEEYEIERDTLLDLLLDEVKANATFLFSDSVTSLTEAHDQVQVSFRSGRTESFSLVLGCDGTHSNVRKLWFGEESQFVVFLKNYFSLSILPKLLMEENRSVMFSVPGKTVMVNTYHGKTDIAFCFASAAEISYDRHSVDQQKSRIQAHFQGGAWRVPELLGEVLASDNFYFDKLCQVHMPSWSKGRVVLVGDAAYCPSPAAGMGGSVALLGASALGEALEQNSNNLPAAFRAYEQCFRPVIEHIQEGAVAFGLPMFMPATQEAIENRNHQLGLTAVK